MKRTTEGRAGSTLGPAALALIRAAKHTDEPRRAAFIRVWAAVANRIAAAMGHRRQALLAKSVGKPTRVTRQVENILGRRATPYAQWASDHADAFRPPARDQGEPRS